MEGEKATVEERLDIMELFARYCWALNTGDEDGYCAVFTKDGWVDHKPQGRCQGPEAMKKLLHQIWYGMPGSYLGRQHMATNFLIRKHPEGIRAKAYATINRLDQTMNQFHLFLVCDWDGLCVVEDGEWRFKELTVTHWYRDTAPWVGDPKVRLKREMEWG